MRTRLAAIILFAAAATLLTSSAFARGEALRAPAGLKPFLLRANEPAAREFPRTPSFSWAPVRGALRYQFQVAKNVTFTDSSVFWQNTNVRGPAVAIPVSLPWMTGNPYAAYARVRAVTNRGLTAWSAPYGFNLRWRQLPQQPPDREDGGFARSITDLPRVTMNWGRRRQGLATVGAFRLGGGSR